MTSQYKGEIMELLEFLGPKLGDQTKSKQTLIKPKNAQKNKIYFCVQSTLGGLRLKSLGLAVVCCVWC